MTQETTTSSAEPQLGQILYRYSVAVGGLRAFAESMHASQKGLARHRNTKIRDEIKQIFEPIRLALPPEDYQAIRAEVGAFFRESARAQAEGQPRQFEFAHPHSQQVASRLMRSARLAIPDWTELQNRNILTSLVTLFETLVADLAHARYSLHPEALGGDIQIAVKDLRTSHSIADVLADITDREVEKLLYKSAEEWINHFEKDLSLNLKSIVPEQSRWLEMFQRRNVMIHSEGIVSRQYLDRVNWSQLGEPAPKIGTRIRVSREYLDQAFDYFEIGGVLLCQEVWRKLLPNDSEHRLAGPPYAGLNTVVYDCLLAERWSVAEHVCRWIETDRQAKQIDVQIAKMNRWLSAKRQGRWDDVATECRAMEADGLALPFRLAHAALCDEHDLFFELLPKAIASDEPNRAALFEWPVLAEVRSDPRWDAAFVRTSALAALPSPTAGIETQSAGSSSASSPAVGT